MAGKAQQLENTKKSLMKAVLPKRLFNCILQLFLYRGKFTAHLYITKIRGSAENFRVRSVLHLIFG
jgi:hypothetical protein